VQHDHESHIMFMMSAISPSSLLIATVHKRRYLRNEIEILPANYQCNNTTTSKKDCVLVIISIMKEVKAVIETMRIQMPQNKSV